MKDDCFPAPNPKIAKTTRHKLIFQQLLPRLLPMLIPFIVFRFAFSKAEKAVGKQRGLDPPFPEGQVYWYAHLASCVPLGSLIAFLRSLT